jgi:hypothetical protein
MNPSLENDGTAAAADPMAAALSGSLSGSIPGLASGAAMPTFEGLLGDFARQNPNLAWLPQMLAAQRQAAAAAPLVEEPDLRQIEIDALTNELAEAQARTAKLQRIARRLAADLEAAQSLLSDLAAAFGACGLCWGEDPLCPSCRGRGKPGRFAPDPELRLRFGGNAEEPPDASRTPTPLGLQR